MASFNELKSAYAVKMSRAVVLACFSIPHGIENCNVMMSSPLAFVVGGDEGQRLARTSPEILGQGLEGLARE